jgi:hypothetical protein
MAGLLAWFVGDGECSVAALLLLHNAGSPVQCVA